MFVQSTWRASGHGLEPYGYEHQDLGLTGKVSSTLLFEVLKSIHKARPATTRKLAFKLV